MNYSCRPIIAALGVLISVITANAQSLVETFNNAPDYTNNWQNSVVYTVGSESITYTSGNLQMFASQSYPYPPGSDVLLASKQVFNGNIDVSFQFNHGGYGRTNVGLIAADETESLPACNCPFMALVALDTDDTNYLNFVVPPNSTEYEYPGTPYMNQWITIRITVQGTQASAYVTVPGNTPTLLTTWPFDTSLGSYRLYFSAGSVPWKSGNNYTSFRSVIANAAESAPHATTSYYVKTTDPKTLRDAGIGLAQNQIASSPHQDSAVILLFGAPTFDTATQSYGATLYQPTMTPFIPLQTISTLVKNFVIGYYNALGSATDIHVRIVVATSNDGNLTNLMSGHGQAWAQMVNTLQSWVLSQEYSGQVDIAGGSDIEQAFHIYSVTSNWVNGYASVVPQRFMYNMGAASGCPPVGAQCDNNWTEDNLWSVSWGITPCVPFPEIYYAKNAAQWANLSSYGLQQYGQAVIIPGALTEQGACGQPGSTCLPPPFTAAQAWQTLSSDLNSQTAQWLLWSTDIKRLYKEQ